MSCPTIKKAFQDSLNKTTLSNADEILVFDNGTIYNVTYGTFVTELGATGSITGENGGSATPVLSGSAPNYTIRGIVGGNGISSQVNAQGSITLDTQIENLGSSQDGLPLIPNTQAAKIGYRRLLAGQGIEIIEDPNSLVIANTEIGVTSKTVIVNDLSDFPDPVSGVITLADNKAYLISNDIATSNRFVLGQNTVIFSNDPFTVTLTYTGSGSMFTFVNGGQSIKQIGLACPNGSLFDSSGVTSGTLLLRYLLISNVKNLGTLKHSFTGIYDVNIVLHTGQGFVYLGATNARFRTQNVILQQTTNASATMLNLNGATFSYFELASWQMLNTAAGQTFLSGLVDGDNLTAGNIGFVNRAVINGQMQPLANIQPSDSNWDFTDCNKIEDTMPRAQIYLTAPATTTITNIGAPVVTAGTFASNIASQFDTNVNGRATYRGIRRNFTRVDITASVEPISGSNKNIGLVFFLNGVEVPETEVDVNVSSSDPKVISVDWGFELDTGDFIEVFVVNNTDTVNIRVNQLLMRFA